MTEEKKPHFHIPYSAESKSSTGSKLLHLYNMSDLKRKDNNLSGYSNNGPVYGPYSGSHHSPQYNSNNCAGGVCHIEQNSRGQTTPE